MKLCKFCKKELVLKKYESPAMFFRRKFCDTSCSAKLNSPMRRKVHVDEAVALLYKEGKVLREIADRFHVSHQAIQGRLSRCMPPEEKSRIAFKNKHKAMMRCLESQGRTHDNS